MLTKIISLLVIFLFDSTKSFPNDSYDWWKNAAIYQIYPRSFKDSDSNGIGDIQGIIQKLNYISETGFDAIWLNSIFQSPQENLGYDVSDYKEVDPIFGTLEDFEELINKTHEKGLRLIMDFVPNHTSIKHEWFQKSEADEDEFGDFYVWRNASDDGGYPNNWISVYHGPAWTWSEKRQQYYLHQYSMNQPDLNYRNQHVFEEMKNILTYWMDKGVDGFRLESTSLIFEDEDFLDEPISRNNLESSPNKYEHLTHVYTKDHLDSYEFVYKLRKFLEEYEEINKCDPKILLTDAMTDLPKTMLYYGSSDNSPLGAHIAMNFQFLIPNPSFEKIVKSVNNWFQHMPESYTPNWILGNHDVHRVATRFGANNVDGYNMLVLLLPGVSITYYGEEIGMENGNVPFELCSDTILCYNEDEYKSKGRDPERTPFLWDSTKNAGFSDAETTWLPVSGEYLGKNLELQVMSAGVGSHYGIFKELMKLRKLEDFSESNTVKIVLINRNTMAFTTSNEKYVVVFNGGSKMASFDFLDYFDVTFESIEIVLASENSEYIVGSTHGIKGFVIHPHESIVGKFTGNAIAFSEVQTTTHTFEYTSQTTENNSTEYFQTSVSDFFITTDSITTTKLMKKNSEEITEKDISEAITKTTTVPTTTTLKVKILEDEDQSLAPSNVESQTKPTTKAENPSTEGMAASLPSVSNAQRISICGLVVIISLSSLFLK